MNTLYVYENNRTKKIGFRHFLDAAYVKNFPLKADFPNKVERYESTWYFVSVDNIDRMRGLEYHRWEQRGTFYIPDKVLCLLNGYCRDG